MEEPPPTCKGCGEVILTEPIVQALNSDWHPKCFRCSSCGKRLNNWYIQNCGHLYCRRDYWAKFADKCNGCSVLISGPVMVAGEHKYHPECFQCSVCQTLIGDGEAYALVERSFLYCGQCYRVGPAKPFSPQLQPQPSQSSSPTLKTSRRKPHSIQVVEIPPTPDSKAQPHHSQQHQHSSHHHSQKQHLEQHQQPASTSRRFHLSLKTIIPDYGPGGYRNSGSYRNSFTLESGRMAPSVAISELDSTADFHGLAVGDKILEVNGATVRDKTLEEISNLLTNYKQPVHVMLERDLSPLRFPPDKDAVASPILGRKTAVKRDGSDDPNSPSTSEGETILIQDQPVRLRPKSSLKARGHSPSRRRSKSPSPCPASRQKSIDLSRSHSFSTRQQDHRVFRAGDLIIGEVLGQGFFGQALKATHRVTGEQMVLKELHNFDEDAQKSFLREVSMLRNLSHPCVLKFMGVLYRDKKLNLVTEFIDGGTLSDLLLNQSVELSWKQRVAFAKDIASGMSYLHSMDIIHRDLNSQNCLVRKDQTVVVADFGLAKIFPRHELIHIFEEKEKEGGGSGSGGSSSAAVTRKKNRFSRRKRGTVVGNPYWMAPEMMTKGVYDEKVDVFSFGIIVCETIARVTPDPDYLPRSIDFGLNVEAFHKRFCQDAPEPYFMLAVLCSQIESDQRPSFEKIHVLCEALHLHVEHGMAVPAELQGSTVKLYHELKEKMYGKNYKDVDSCTQANTDKNKNATESDAINMSTNNAEELYSTLDLASDEGESKSNYNSSGSCSSREGGGSSPALMTKQLPVTVDTVELDQKLHSLSVKAQHSNNNAANHEKNTAVSKDSRMNSDDGVGESSTATTTNEDYAYFSCSSSPSMSPSSACLSGETFASCKSSPSASGEQITSQACDNVSNLQDNNLSQATETGSSSKLLQEISQNLPFQTGYLPLSGTIYTNNAAHLPSLLTSTSLSHTHSSASGNMFSPDCQSRQFQTSMQLENGMQVSTLPSSSPSSGFTSIGINEPIGSVSSSVMSSATNETVNLSPKDQHLPAQNQSKLCSNLVPCVPYDNSYDFSSLFPPASENGNGSPRVDSKSSARDIHLRQQSQESNGPVSHCVIAVSPAEGMRNIDEYETTQDNSKKLMDTLTVVTSEDGPDESKDSDDAMERSPITLSPKHEMGLSSSRRRLKRSLKTRPPRDHSPYPDQS